MHGLETLLGQMGPIHCEFAAVLMRLVVEFMHGARAKETTEPLIAGATSLRTLAKGAVHVTWLKRAIYPTANTPVI